MAKKTKSVKKDEKTGLSRWFSFWGSRTKKGATFTDKDGEIKELSDFQRGVAAGRMKQKK